MRKWLQGSLLRSRSNAGVKVIIYAFPFVREIQRGKIHKDNRVVLIVESARAAIDSGADIVMLDNFGADEIKVVAKRLKETYGNRVLIECSGGLTTENCVDYFSEYLDILSFGSLTQGVPHVDFSLKIVPE